MGNQPCALLAFARRRQGTRRREDRPANVWLRRSAGTSVGGEEALMAYASREIAASTADVYAVLIDPRSYPSWLPGAEGIREVDADWPAPGSRFHHRVRFG